jgi:hypothetical protein
MARAATAEIPAEAGSIETWMNFAGDIKGRARVDVPDWSRTNLVLDKHDVRIFDGRAVRDELDFDREGFRLLDHESVISADSDLTVEAVRDGYLASVAELLKQTVGADLVLAQGTGLLKRHAERANIKGAIGPSRWAHMDYTEYAAHKWVGWIEGWQGLELRQYPRFSIFQTWRCLSPAPQDNTLVLCDASTIKPEGLIVFDACMRQPYDGPGNQFESQLCHYDPDQRWLYFPNLTADELIVFKAFDSAPGWNSQALHNSADIPGLPSDAAPRISVEARFFAFWE